jgi:hypothetical protein
MRRSLGLALFVAAANLASAQYVVSARAGTIHFTTGQILVDDQPLERKSTQFPTLRDGQLLRTKDGRAEILLGPGVFLRLGPHAAMRMVNSRLEDTQVEIQQGLALVEVIEIANGSNLHVLLRNARTAFRGIGLHRFDAETGDLYVYGGHAEISTGGQTLDASRGRVVHLRDAPTQSRFDPREKNDLLQWAARRSFRLFISNPLARMRLTNWEVSTLSPIPSDQNRSYFFNPDFGVTYVSRISGRSALADLAQPPISERKNPEPVGPTHPSGQVFGYPGPASAGQAPY